MSKKPKIERKRKKDDPERAKKAQRAFRIRKRLRAGEAVEQSDLDFLAKWERETGRKPREPIPSLATGGRPSSPVDAAIGNQPQVSEPAQETPVGENAPPPIDVTPSPSEEHSDATSENPPSSEGAAPSPGPDQRVLLAAVIAEGYTDMLWKLNEVLAKENMLHLPEAFCKHIVRPATERLALKYLPADASLDDADEYVVFGSAGVTAVQHGRRYLEKRKVAKAQPVKVHRVNDVFPMPKPVPPKEPEKAKTEAKEEGAKEPAPPTIVEKVVEKVVAVGENGLPLNAVF